ncbi:discoidin domain-containing protein [Micromonospora sp. NPDC049645]|uniref:discoidin domain-containing protein n=1 Tax=Micromonospora sp. NPDC049645 TaxID=3155508 RepID=UPI003414EB00
MQRSVSRASRTGRRRSALAAAVSGLAVFVTYALAVNIPSATATATASAGCGTTNVALNRPATASSVENSRLSAANAVDGSATTRWSSAFSDPQWLQVDLGASTEVCEVVLTWQTSYAKAFQLQVSPDGVGNWSSLYATATGSGGTQTIPVSGTGRFLRVYGTSRATGYGYSLFELVVHSGSTPTTPPPTTGPPIPGGGDLGSNVIVFDPSMSSSSIQSKLDQVFATQETNQFGTQRYALLFKPGSYTGLNAQLGFYTSIAGLGQNPADVQINGDVTVDAGWMAGNATQNFWRSAENMSITPVSGRDRWAVAQAAPFRRMDVHGGMTLASPNCGWASGGYIADSRISGTVSPCSQQQWYTRDSQVGGWNGGVWNVVFSGVAGAPANTFPKPPYTVVPKTPVSREKPYLYTDSSGAYRVFVPSLRTNSSGVTWAAGNTAGTSLPLTQFYVAHPGDSAATINSALAQGLNLLFTPGVYRVGQTINVTRPDTVVLGLGFATLIADNGVTAMNVADVNGVRVAGLLFDAGTARSPSLLQVGQKRRERGPRRQSDLAPGRVPARRRRRSGRRHQRPGGKQQQHDHRPHLGLACRPRRRGRVDHEPVRHRPGRQRRRRHRARPLRRALPEVQRGLERQPRPNHLLPERTALRPSERGSLVARRHHRLRRLQGGQLGDQPRGLGAR